MIKVSPSILAADPLRLGEEAQRMVDAGCDWLHVDILDGCFVPNLSYGPSLVKALRGRFSIPLDVHLMIAHPERYVETFIAAGADWLTIHAEAAADLPALLREAEICRANGYAIDDEENEMGVRCVAVAIPGPDGRAESAFSISGLAPYMTPERIRRVAALALDTRTDILADLGVGRKG